MNNKTVRAYLRKANERDKKGTHKMSDSGRKREEEHAGQRHSGPSGSTVDTL